MILSGKVQESKEVCQGKIDGRVGKKPEDSLPARAGHTILWMGRSGTLLADRKEGHRPPGIKRRQLGGMPPHARNGRQTS